MPLERTGIANLPLHYGSAPRWLFERMVKLSREITIVIASEYGATEMLKRLSNPFWFQSFGCVLGFDWHSSGVTTTLCGALKEGLKGIECDLGLFVAGGKGSESRKTPAELTDWGEKLGFDASPLVYDSRMSAKVDSAALQDGYQIYHHSFFFTRDVLQGWAKPHWAVVQQGMNETNHYARRYHWLGEEVQNFVNEPHTAILSETKGQALNLVASESEKARTTISDIVLTEKPEQILNDIARVRTLTLPAHHYLSTSDMHPESLKKIILSAYEAQPQDFERLLGLPGVGPKTIRALSLISELIYGVAPSYRDPARYSFAHGGKDGIPYPVDRPTYDQSIEVLAKAIDKAKLQLTEKKQAMSRLDMMRFSTRTLL